MSATGPCIWVCLCSLCSRVTWQLCYLFVCFQFPQDTCSTLVPSAQFRLSSWLLTKFVEFVEFLFGICEPLEKERFCLDSSHCLVSYLPRGLSNCIFWGDEMEKEKERREADRDRWRQKDRDIETKTDRDRQRKKERSTQHTFSKDRHFNAAHKRGLYDAKRKE